MFFKLVLRRITVQVDRVKHALEVCFGFEET